MQYSLKQLGFSQNFLRISKTIKTKIISIIQAIQCKQSSTSQSRFTVLRTSLTPPPSTHFYLPRARSLASLKLPYPIHSLSEESSPYHFLFKLTLQNTPYQSPISYCHFSFVFGEFSSEIFYPKNSIRGQFISGKFYLKRYHHIAYSMNL